MLAQEPLLQLLDASLQRMLDKVPQSRARITTAQRRITDAIRDRDVETARTWMARHIRDFRKGYDLAEIDLNSRVDD
jgi:DNA-binding GntR family transcriptional regulator